jgi:hypothetical protein
VPPILNQAYLNPESSQKIMGFQENLQYKESLNFSTLQLERRSKKFYQD